MVPWAKRNVRRALIGAMHARVAATNRRGAANSRIESILVVRPDHLGDLLFATPALRLLRDSFPDARITAAVGPWGRAMWANNPDLDALITIPFPGIAGARDGGPLAPYMLLGKAASAIAENRYDLGIALRFDHWWGAALMWAAGVPRRWGYDTPGMGAWLTHPVPYKAGRHEVEQGYRLAEAAARGSGKWRGMSLTVDRERGLPPLRPPTPTPMQGDATREWHDAPRRTAIHPGTGSANKLWVIQGWAEVAAKLRESGWAVAITGAPGEAGLAAAIVAACPADGAGKQPPLANLAGKTATLNELTGLFEHAHIVLGVDSGPLHIAAALRKPTLHLYGPSDESIWGPWGDPRLHRVLRAPGTRPTGHLTPGSAALEGGPDMRSITVAMVISELQQMLDHD